MIGLVAAHRREALLVERAQNFGLRLQAHVADFIQEQRAAVGLLELAFLVGGGAGKRAFAMAEQLALDQVFRNGGAVHLDEHLVLAQAVRVDGVGHQFFAGARFAIDQHAAVGGRHERICWRSAFMGMLSPTMTLFGVQLLLQLAVFLLQSAWHRGRS